MRSFRHLASSRRPTLQPINVPQLTTESLNNPIKFDDYRKDELIKEEEERLEAFKVKRRLVLEIFCQREAHFF